MNYPNPLTEQDFNTLNQLCQHCHATGQMIEDCKACGLPVDEFEARNHAQNQAATNLKKKFFPLNP